MSSCLRVKDPVEPNTFWVNPFGLAFSLIKASDLIQVDHDGKVLAGGPLRMLNTAAFLIHSASMFPLRMLVCRLTRPHAVHQARPDVMCIAHSHSIYGRTFCSLGRPLDIITQDACAFHNDLAMYSDFNGIVLADQEGKSIAECLGGKKAALLQNHGILTVGATIEATIFWFMSLEKCCHTQLMADAAAAGRGGQTIKIGDEEAAFTYKTVGVPVAGWFRAKPLFDNIHRETGGDYLN